MLSHCLKLVVIAWICVVLLVITGFWYQPAAIIPWGYLAVAFYVVFKFCEKVLVERLSNARENWS